MYSPKDSIDVTGIFIFPFAWLFGYQVSHHAEDKIALVFEGSPSFSSVAATEFWLTCITFGSHH